jgi:hypothetical protein
MDTLSLNFYTDDKLCGVPANAPDRAYNFMPSWFKEIKPVSFEDCLNTEMNQLCQQDGQVIPLKYRGMKAHQNMSKCQGFKNLFKRGFYVVCPEDIVIQIGARNTDAELIFNSSSKTLNLIQVHGPDQYNSCFDPKEWQHLKINIPWIAQCDEDIPFMFTKASWFLDELEGLEIMPGVLEYKYQHGLHVNMFIRKKESPERYVFKLGTPLAHVIPLTERKLDIKHHHELSEELKEYTQTNMKMAYSPYSRNKKRAVLKQARGIEQ